MKETGASCVKMEGGAELAETIAFLTTRGIPVMAHIGLMPQHMHTVGGFKTQGKEKAHHPCKHVDGQGGEHRAYAAFNSQRCKKRDGNHQP